MGRSGDVCPRRGGWRRPTMRRDRRTAWLAGFVVVLVTRATQGQIPERPEVALPGLTPAGKVLLPNGWSLKPAGIAVVSDGRLPGRDRRPPESSRCSRSSTPATERTRSSRSMPPSDGKIIARVTVEGELRRPRLVEGRQAALCGRRVRRRGLSVRPRRGACFPTVSTYPRPIRTRTTELRPRPRRAGNLGG